MSRLFFLPGIIATMVGMSVCGTSIYNLMPVVLAELCGPDSISTGLGLQIFTQSLSFLSSSFVAGMLTRWHIPM